METLEMQQLAWEWIFDRQERYAEAAERLTTLFKCNRCGHCCQNAPCNVMLQDMQNLSKYLGRDIKHLAQYVNYRSWGGQTRVYLRTPCPFVSKKRGEPAKCKIYPARPLACRTYPLGTEILMMPEQCQLARDIKSWIEQHGKQIWPKLKEIEDPVDHQMRKVIAKQLGPPREDGFHHWIKTLNKMAGDLKRDTFQAPVMSMPLEAVITIIKTKEMK